MCFFLIINNPNWKSSINLEKEENILLLVLTEAEDCVESFEKFLRFFYIGEINLDNKKSFQGLISLADKYNVKKIRDLFSEFMIAKPRTSHLHGALEFCPYGLK